MSDFHTTGQGELQEKLIKIKPMELIKNEPTYLTAKEIPDDKGQDLQRELQTAYETLQNVKDQQNQLIKETKAAIEREKTKWEAEKQAYIEQAKELGYQTGFALGKRESISEYEHLLEKANAITEAATTDYHATLEQSDQMILDIAIHTAEKIIKQSLTENPKSFLPIVTEAIKEIKNQGAITIYLHPDNYTFVLQQKEELSRILNDEKEIAVYINEKAQIGNCLIEHPYGQLNASIDTQLQQIRNVLHDVAMENKQ